MKVLMKIKTTNADDFLVLAEDRGCFKTGFLQPGDYLTSMERHATQWEALERFHQLEDDHTKPTED